MATADLLERARAGDGEAFGELAGPYRRELRVHGHRMLGSVQDRYPVARYCARPFAAGRRYDLVPAQANGQPAFGAYLRGPDRIRLATGLNVLTLAGDQTRGITRFDTSVLPWFGLSRSLPSRQLS